MKKTALVVLLLVLGGCLNLDLMGMRKIMGMDPYDVDVVTARALLAISPGVSFKTPPKVTMKKKENGEIVREETFILQAIPVTEQMNLPTQFLKLNQDGYIIQLDPKDAARAVEIQDLSRELDKNHDWVEPQTEGRTASEQANQARPEWDISLSWNLELDAAQRHKICVRGKSPKTSIWVDIGDGKGLFRVLRNMPVRKMYNQNNWQGVFCKPPKDEQ